MMQFVFLLTFINKRMNAEEDVCKSNNNACIQKAEVMSAYYHKAFKNNFLLRYGFT